MDMKTYLNKEQITRLANEFGDKEQYTEHLKTLWSLREAVSDKLGINRGVPKDVIMADPLFKVFNLTNRLINALDDGSISIVNGKVQVKEY